MLLTLRNKLLPVQFAIIALVFNAFMQAQCCASAFAGAEGDSFWAEARASLCLNDSEHGETDTAGDLAAFEVWAQAMGAPPADGHASHGSGHADSDCDCADSICGPGLVVPAAVQEASVDQVAAETMSPAKEVRHAMAHEASIFSARGPPHSLL